MLFLFKLKQTISRLHDCRDVLWRFVLMKRKKMWIWNKKKISVKCWHCNLYSEIRKNKKNITSGSHKRKFRLKVVPQLFVWPKHQTSFLGFSLRGIHRKIGQVTFKEHHHASWENFLTCADKYIKQFSVGQGRARQLEMSSVTSLALSSKVRTTKRKGRTLPLEFPALCQVFFFKK